MYYKNSIRIRAGRQPRYVTIVLLPLFITLCLLMFVLPAVGGYGQPVGYSGFSSEEDTPCCGPAPINGTVGTPLYMKGSDPSQGRLTKDFPADNISETSTILPGSGVLEQRLGTWTSEPLKYEWVVDGRVDLQIGAYGNGYSYTTDVRFEVLLDGDVMGEIEIHDNPMRPSLKFWLGNTTLSLTVAPGQTLGFRLYMTENGPGGELRWDATSSAGMMWFHTPSTKVFLEDQSFGGRHTSTIHAFSPWGRHEIDELGIFVAMPPEEPGDNPWSDIGNGSFITIEDVCTVDWTETEYENDFVVGVWVWEEQQEISPQARMVGFAFDGGEAPTFQSEIVGKGAGDSGDQTTLFSGTNGGMFVTGIILLTASLSCLLVTRHRQGNVAWAESVGDPDLDETETVQDLPATTRLSTRDKALMVGALVAVFLIVAPIFFVIADPGEKEPQDFTLTSIDGEIFQLSDFRGKVVFLHFGGTECDRIRTVKWSNGSLPIYR